MTADNPLRSIDIDAIVEGLRGDVLRSVDRMAPSLSEHLVVSRSTRRAVPWGQPAEMQSWYARAVDLLVRFICGNDNATDPEAWKGLGRDRASRGDVEDAVIEDVGDVATAVWRAVLDKAASIEAPGPIAIEATARLHALLESAVEQARDDLKSGFSEGGGDLAGAGRPQALFVNRLLSASFVNDRDIRDAAMRVGYSMAASQVLLVVFRCSDDMGVVPDAGLRAVADELRGIRGPVRSQPRWHAAVLAPCLSKDAYKAALRTADEIAVDHHSIVLAIGPVDQPIRLAAEYQGLLRDVAVVDLTTSLPAAVDWADFSQHRILSRAPFAERFGFVITILGRLLAHPRWETLLATLAAILETNEGREGAARRLGVSSSTVRLRLRTIKEKELLDESLTNPRELLRVFTAVAFARTMTEEIRNTLQPPRPLPG